MKFGMKNKSKNGIK